MDLLTHIVTAISAVASLASAVINLAAAHQRLPRRRWSTKKKRRHRQRP